MNINRVLSINPLNVLSHSGFGVGAMQHITDCYGEDHRHYHDIIHIKEMLAYVEPFSNRLSMNEWEALELAIVWHDSIYNPLSKTNEEDSYQDFIDHFQQLDDKYIHLEKWQAILPMVQEMILATKHHEYDQSIPEYVRLIVEADLDRFRGPFESFWKNTLDIMKEYAMIDWAGFKAGRIAFLRSYADKVKKIVGQEGYDNCMKSADVLSVWQPKIAVYAGSFDPFHKGHLRMIEKAEKIFDKVIIARGQNPTKPAHQTEIPDSLKLSHQVEGYVGWITNYLKTKEYPVTLIRGLRNGSDMAGEMNFERYLKDLMPDIQIVSIFTDPDVEHISSSGYKEMKKSMVEGDVLPDYLVN